MKFETINPATETILEHFQQSKDDQINEIMEKCHHAHLEWRLIYLYTRAKYFKKLSDIIQKRKNELAQMITEEMGKPIAQSLAEIEKCAQMCEYYAHNGPQFLDDELVKTEAEKSFVTYQPLGIILGIMPWNFPFWQVLRFAVPAIMAGNSVILKHAPNVCRSALTLEKLFNEADFPEGLFKTVFVDIPRIPSLIEHPYIQGVSLTGSEKAGRSVGELAGKNLKRAVLELGGSDPYVIFHDADLELAVETCVTSRLVNCGQSCISAKRFIVDQTIAEEFEELFAEKMKMKTMGDPSGNVHLGPMARKDLRDNLHNQVQQSIDKGAKLLTGGEVPDIKGYYYPPTVLANVHPGMNVWDEETFGPVAAISRFSTELEAIRLALDTPYGLGAALFSRDIERVEKIAKYKIMSGNVFINDYVKSDPRLPFGGVKASGFGRELSYFGIREFVNIKTIFIK
ncbi:MAG: NAD-dependent succinate-semialdehyde dehydrogenase [Spirochaetia bacterium]|nr:NAD-dependent succinate-semialdehyde dehydrogenase [Spirochaetia bacterium]